MQCTKRELKLHIIPKKTEKVRCSGGNLSEHISAFAGITTCCHLLFISCEQTANIYSLYYTTVAWSLRSAQALEWRQRRASSSRVLSLRGLLAGRWHRAHDAFREMRTAETTTWSQFPAIYYVCSLASVQESIITRRRSRSWKGSYETWCSLVRNHDGDVNENVS